jgi:hypothetical protein
LFSDISRDDEYFGVIAQGQINQEQFLLAIQEETKHTFTSMDYKGRQIHVTQHEEDIPAVSFLEGNTLVMGTLPAVQAVIDVQEGDQTRVSGKVYDTFAGLGDPCSAWLCRCRPKP